MIGTCRYCKHTYWRYDAEFPPRPFCSVPCKVYWFMDKTAGREAEPPIPAAMLQLFLSHRRIVHQVDSVLVWCDCEECDRLEREYAASIKYHYREISTEIAVQARAAREVSFSAGGGQNGG